MLLSPPPLPLRAISPILKTLTPLIPSSYSSADLLHLSGLLNLAIDRHSLKLAQQAHARTFSLGLYRLPFLSTKLISAYSLLGFPSHCRLVFDSIPDKNNVFLWNSLLAAYSRNHLFEEPIALFNQMGAHESPDNYTLSIVSKASAELRDLRMGRTVHSLIVGFGYGSDTVLMNSLMVMYFKCGRAIDARQLFDEIPVRSVTSWNALISEYMSLGGGLYRGEIWKLVMQMQMEGMKPDAFTVSTILPLCAAHRGSQLRGREIHCFVVKHNLDLGSGSDFHVGSCLIDVYSKGKNVNMGRRVFNQMVSKNVVTWTAMITGYVENRNFEEALTLFRAMQSSDGTMPNKVTLLSVLPAIGSLASIMEGKQIHGFAIRTELNREVSLNNALIDMYSKCGSLDCARRVFDCEWWHKDVISWSSMVSCYGIYGRGKEALSLFNKMCTLGIKLDHVTSVGLLSACGRAGLVTEGFEVYNSLVKNHGVHPTVEMSSCMVDMLGRAGQLDKALEFINSMLVEPGPSVWGALFCASVIHGNREMQNLASRILLQSEPENPSNYVSLSNVHASWGKWDVAAEVRTRMKERGLKKLPGCSWINVNSSVHSFYVADKSHRCSDMIYAVLNSLLLAIKGAGYVPSFDNLT